MTNIATVTLNPAVDLTVRIDNFQPNTVNRTQEMQFDAGGKGVNVASFLADYGYDTAVTGFLGSENTDIFEQLFKRKRIEDRFVRIPGRTRTGIKVVDEVRKQTTDINMSGLTPSAEEIQRLFTAIEELTTTCDWFVLAGSLPPHVPISIYTRIIEQLKAKGKYVVLDTSQDALREGLLAGPSIIKPNIDELQQLIGQTLSDEAAIEQAARHLLNDGVHMVVVSMGKNGALFIDRQTALFAVPPTVVVKSSVGAGDAMVAGLLAGLAQKMSLADCARLATAFSVGTITQVGPHLPARQTIDAYVRQVTIRTPE